MSGTAKRTKAKTKRDVTHFLRAWREYHDLSMDKLANACEPPFSSSFISQLELGRTSYTQQALERLAKALGTEPWQILVRDPETSMIGFALRKLDGIFDDVPLDRRSEVESVLDQMGADFERLVINFVKATFALPAGRSPKKDGST